MLNWERELIGLYISDHPLNEFQTSSRRSSAISRGSSPKPITRKKSAWRGWSPTCARTPPKRASRWASSPSKIFKATSNSCSSPRPGTNRARKMTVGQIVIVEGKVDQSSTPPKILVDTIKTEIKMTMAANDPYIKGTRLPSRCSPGQRSNLPAARRRFPTQDSAAPVLHAQTESNAEAESAEPNLCLSRRSA
jgi:hypothetical protein